MLPPTVPVRRLTLPVNPWRGLKGLSADVWVIFATTLVNRAGTMVLPFLVLYLVQPLGQPPSLAAFALTVYGFGALISAPIAGRLSDRLGALRVMQGSLLFSGGLLLVFPLLRALPLVFGLTLVWAVIAQGVR